MDERDLETSLARIFSHGMIETWGDTMVLTDQVHTRQAAIRFGEHLSLPGRLETGFGCRYYDQFEGTATLALMDLDLLIESLEAMRNAGWQVVALRTIVSHLAHRGHEASVIELIPWLSERADDCEFPPFDIRILVAGCAAVSEREREDYKAIKRGDMPTWVRRATRSNDNAGAWFDRMGSGGP